MVPTPRTETRQNSHARRIPAVAAAAAVVAALLIPTTAAHGAPADSFASSFEADDAAPALVGTGESSNLDGGRFAPGSALPFVEEVTASAENPPAEVAANLADGNASSKWLAFDATGWAQYALSEPQPIEAYTLTSGNDAPDRDPRDFRVLGSNDGEDWTLVDERSGESAFHARGETRTFALDAATEPFAFYRLDIGAVQRGSIVQLAGFEPIVDADAVAESSDLTLEVGSGPTSSSTAKTGVGFDGVRALRYAGTHMADGGARSTVTVYDDLEIAVEDDTELSYALFPVLDAGQSYSATFAAVDLVFDDGSTLSASDAEDASGYRADAASQGASKKLWPDQWNRVSVDLSGFAGRTVTEIRFAYDRTGDAIAGIEKPVAGTPVSGWLDDIRIAAAAPRDTSDGLVSYVDTTRGTNSSGGFSRGNNFPATAVPNGFNFITPMTDADSTGTLYAYQAQNTADNRPALEAIGFSHEPSIWMGDRNQLAVLPQAEASPTSSLSERRLAFGHENETARPDIYSVEFDNGISTSVTPTDHGAVYRFGFEGDASSVIVDKGAGSSKLAIDGDEVSGWVEGGSGWPGRTRMFVYGEFDRVPVASGATERGDRTASARFAAFDTADDDSVELRIASSFISQDQAERNFSLELDGVSFDDAQAAARDAWNERLGVVHDVKGATDAQLETLYSSLYRLNLYPNSQFENVGTAESPEYAYASPVSPTSGSATDTETNAKVVDGRIYVNNGFWDTYRTAWPLYSLLYPDVTDDLVDGFVQQYRDGGWIARWSSPGYADLMTGTSSDVAFAEAYLAGALDTSTALDAYDAALKNATVRPDSNAVGRKGLERSIFLGYTDRSTHQSVSWGLEGFVNDFGIARMAAALADDPNTPTERVDTLREEAAYFEARAGHYAEMFNPDAGVFTARNADGSWPYGEEYDKKDWNEDVTEASAWTFAFHAPFDVDGMAALYGGRQGLIDELHSFLTEREQAAYSGIHEAREARDVRLGMLGMSNQVAHHIPYVLAEAGDPTGAQELIRDIQNRMFVGGDIGQGYPGDEDNGEFSAWYVFSALGFYPLANGSGDYTIGTPLFDSATLTIGGRDVRIDAPGASDGKTYVAGVDIDGTEVTETTFDGDLLRSGSTVTFEMSDAPSGWGAKDLDERLGEPAALLDATKPGRGTLTASDGTATDVLVDDHMLSAARFDKGEAELTWRSASGPVTVDQYTLTGIDASTAPRAWTLWGSADGETWTELDARSGQEFRWGAQTRPFSVDDDGAFTQLRLEITGGDALELAEVELFASSAGASELTVTAAADQRVRVGEEFDGTVATIAGADGGPDELDVTVEYGDGETADAIVGRDQLSGLTVSAPHTFDAPGVYDAAVTVRDASGAVATAVAKVEAYRDLTQDGAYTNNCIGSVADRIAANCDGQGAGYDRDDLAADGFVQGETHAVGETGLTFDLPAIPTGEPDNITGEGQTFRPDLGDGATRISFIGTATESSRSPQATLTFTDGTTQQVEIGFGDWVGSVGDPAFGNTEIARVETRMSGTGVGNQHAAIFATAPVALDTDDAGDPKTVASLTMPDEAGSVSSGRVHVFAIASDGDRTEPPAPLEVAAAAVPQQVAGIAFDAELATITGGSPERTAVVNWGDGTGTGPAEVADASVSGSHRYETPGVYEVAVTVDDGEASRTATLRIEVVADEPEYAPEIAAEPDRVAPGDDVAVTGTGFAPDEAVSIALGDGDPVATAADGDGSVSAVLTVPDDAPDGTYPIVALGETSRVEAATSVVVRAPQAGPEETAITLSTGASDVAVGDTITLVAAVTPPDAVGTVAITSRGSTVARASSSGTTEFEVLIDKPGTHRYVATFVPEDPAAYRESTSAALKVKAKNAPVREAHLAIDAESVVQGGDVRVSGRGYRAGESVEITLHSAPVGVAEVTADERGAFRATVTIPASAAVGDHRLVAEGAASGLSAEAPLTVTAAMPDDLAVTGSTVPYGLIAAVVALLLVGAIILIVTRRRRRG